MSIKQIANSEEAVIVDVRTPWEYSMGHIPGSINITLAEIPRKVEDLRTFNGPIVLVCATGNRSGQATRFLQQMGFQNVYNGGGWYEMDQVKKRA